MTGLDVAFAGIGVGVNAKGEDCSVGGQNVLGGGSASTASGVDVSRSSFNDGSNRYNVSNMSQNFGRHLGSISQQALMSSTQCSLSSPSNGGL